MIVEYSARSHIGKIRKSNEDNMFVNGEVIPLCSQNRSISIDGVADAPCVFAVCDGMGGEDYGELASYIAVKRIERFQKRFCTSPDHGIKYVVHDYVRETDQAIREEVGCGKRAGTTIALSVITNRKIHCFSMGDTKIYAIKKGTLQQISNDHTWVAEMMQQTRPLTQSVINENLHKITRCMGIGPKADADSYPPVTGKCRLLICSDGVTDMVSDAELKEILTDNNSVSDAADLLLSLALDKGGYDNTTLIIVDTSSEHSKGLKKLFHVSLN